MNNTEHTNNLYGEEPKKEDSALCTTESRSCTPKTSTTLKINSTPVKKKNGVGRGRVPRRNAVTLWLFALRETVKTCADGQLHSQGAIKKTTCPQGISWGMTSEKISKQGRCSRTQFQELFHSPCLQKEKMSILLNIREVQIKSTNRFPHTIHSGHCPKDNAGNGVGKWKAPCTRGEKVN